MATSWTFSDATGVHDYKGFLDIDLTSQSITNNTSTLKWTFYVTGTWGAYSYNTSSGNVDINGNKTFTKDGFSGTKFTLKSGTVTVTHNSDGTKTVSGIDAKWTSGHSSVGNVSITSKSITLPTIPRASKPTVSDSSVTTRSAVTIYTHRKSSAFTHTLRLKYGSSSVLTIATGVTSSHSWTIPDSVLTHIPNSTSGTYTITCDTYNGSTKIGSTTTVNIKITANSAVVPDAGSVSDSEYVSEVASKVGKYVQGKSRLTLHLSGHSGVQGSSIKSISITVNGQTIGSASGTTGVITGSGNQTISWKVTDSRGRSASGSKTVAVLAYSAPKISGFKVERCTSSGASSRTGEWFKITANTTVSSLKNGSTEKNTLKWTAYKKARTTTSWGSAVGTKTGTPPTLNSTYYNSGSTGKILLTDSADVRLVVSDIFENTDAVGVISTEAVIAHMGYSGFGVGKYWERGALDVSGDIYAKNLYLTGTGDAGLDPYGQALTIGEITGPNVAIDNNELQARNNGAAADFMINGEGGNVLLSKAGSTVQVRGRLDYSANDLVVLWHSSGGSYMSGSQSITLSQGVLSQNTGIVLHWQAYSDGSPTNSNHTYCFIPKWHVLSLSGAGVSCLLEYLGGGNTSVIRKYVYVGNTTISGNDLNQTATNANTRVLTDVFGV